MTASCIFCKIVRKELPAKVIAESDSVVVIQDRAPKAPIHYLIIPKQHVPDVMSLDEQTKFIVADMFSMARQMGQQLPDPQAFRLLVNNGAAAGQSVFHLHVHFLSGKIMGGF